VRNLSISIRRAQPSDLEALYKIEVECFHEDAFPRQYIRQFIEKPYFITLVALINNEVIGFIAGSMETFYGKSAGHIYSIDVRPEYRGMGVGSHLLEATEKELKRDGAEICYLEARTDNIVALNLYLKHNYKVVEQLRNYYGIGRNGMRLMKSLVTE